MENPSAQDSNTPFGQANPLDRTKALQRAFPHLPLKGIKPEDLFGKKVLELLPSVDWERLDQEEIAIIDPKTGETLALYLTSEAKAQEWDEKTGGIHPHPIYLIESPDLEKKDQLVNIEVELVAHPPSEYLKWTEVQTLQDILKKKKDEKKKALLEELALLPKEEIWKGFRAEPGEFPTGYKPQKDPKTWWFSGLGNPYAKIWIVGLYPSNEEIKTGRIYAGGSGKEIAAALEAAGLSGETDVYLDNIVKRYMPPKSKMGAEIKLEQMWLLRRQLSLYRPERVICLGAEVFKEFVGSSTTFAKSRGIWVEVTYPARNHEPEFKAWKGRVAGTFHPAGCLRPEGRKNLPILRNDLHALLLDKNPEEITVPNEEVRNLQALEAWVQKEIEFLDALPEGQKALYALDTEGYGAAPQRDKFVSIQFCPILCREIIPAEDISEEAKGTWMPLPKIQLLPFEALPRTTTLLFREHTEPDHISKESFLWSQDQAMAPVQAEMFLELEPPKKAEAQEEPEEKPPVILVAESPEAAQEAKRKHQEKRPDRDLYIFRPDLVKLHLAGHEHKVGKILEELATHPNMAGFGLTNVNYDRIRLEEQLGTDLLSQSVIYPYPLDTMIGEHVTDENNELGLKPSLNRRLGWPRQDRKLEVFAKEFNLKDLSSKVTTAPRSSAWALYPWTVLKEYAALDAYGCASLLVAQFKDMASQEEIYQPGQKSDNVRQAFHISCGALNGTYEMHKYGMPVGQKGLGVLKELTSFYANHEEKLVSEYQERVYSITGFRDANPSSPQELAYILFNPKSPLSQRGIQPWKEGGTKGRLWEEISEEERHNCTPSTDAESLEIIASNCPDQEIQNFLTRLSEIKTILTIREDFLPDLEYGRTKSKGIIGRLNWDTMCLHTTYTPTLDTARCRSVPNLSTFPKGEIKRVKKILGEAPPFKIREIISAPEGTLLLNRDWMTAEVLALGYLSMDPNMLQIISKMSEGMDFHAKLAIPTYPIIRETIAIFGEHEAPPNDWLNNTIPEGRRKEFCEKWTEFWEDRIEKGRRGPLTEGESHQLTKELFSQERGNIKPVTFGVPYGRSAAAIMKQLNREYYIEDVRGPDGNILKVTLDEAQAMIDSYKITEFSGAWAYLEEQARQGVENGFLKDVWGYIRHFPKGTREDEVTRKAYNYQIQHLVAAVMNIAMADWIRRRKETKLKSYAYATLYDNIGWVAYEDELQQVWDLSQTVMTTERPIGPKTGSRPEMANWHFPADGQFSHTWEGKGLKPHEVGVTVNPAANLTGLE
jgi:uracil-DNA glycosylase family 4